MFVLGCHRSGTSLLASFLVRVLEHCGASLCSNDSRLPPQVDNPGGFFESHRIVNLNENLLGRLSINWQHPPLHPIDWQDASLMSILSASRAQFDNLALSSRWVDKDPRLCITYPAFDHIFLRNVPITAIIRHPFSVARSLQARNGLAVGHCLLIWFLYNKHLARSISASRDVLFSYDSLLDGDPSSLWRLSDFLILQDISAFGLEDLLKASVCYEWQRSLAEWPTSFLPEPEWKSLAETCLEAYEKVKSHDFSIASFKQAFDSIPETVLLAYAVHSYKPAPIQDDSNAVVVDTRQLAEALRRAEDELLALRQSLTWRFTAPLRRVLDATKSIFL